MSPLISVIIPTYNRKKQCVEAINSVVAQSYNNFEIIVVDDCSTDGSQEEISAFVSGLSNVKFIELDKNSGVSSARNRGIEEAEGEWFALLDSDDVWDIEKLEKQISWLSSNPEYRICQTKERWVRDGKVIAVPKQFRKRAGDIFEISLKRCMITPSSAVIHKSLLDEKGVFDETLPACEDYDLWLRISSTEKVGLIDEELMTRFGGNEDQLSLIVKLQDIYRVKSLIQLLNKSYLNGKQSDMVRLVIVKKASVISNGALKRGNRERYMEYKAVADTYK